MNNINTGITVVFILFVGLLLYIFIRDLRTNNLRRFFLQLAELIYEIIKSAAIAVVIFAIFAGVVWLIGFLVNSIWDLIS